MSETTEEEEVEEGYLSSTASSSATKEICIWEMSFCQEKKVHPQYTALSEKESGIYFSKILLFCCWIQ